MGLEQAAAMLSAAGRVCAAADLLKAKKAGVRAFRSSRIYFEETLFEWLEANPSEPELPEAPDDEGALESKEILERRKLREVFLRAKKARLAEDGKYISLAEFRAKSTQAMVLYRASGNSLRADAPQWSGMPPHEILRRVTDRLDQGYRELETAFRKLAHGA